ncbi:tRNA (uracil(54)-C(5))-methyltransferase [Symbiodinium microadriaticum]|uniref:tRNA (Uracil(54)-C(5))-methyltransferase n=1 Tax=Symbiodinium microadriaticum TaxID=2951 RepID=A0A1Q9CTA2_SYMMI|nr:tRNA (uracil(54)-C(5))-methyltransferase [Symbiodinium microadriaticum]
MSIAWLLPTLRDGHLNFALGKIVAAPGQGAVGGFWQSRGKWCFVVLSTFPRLDDIDYSAIGFLEQEWGSTRDASGRRWRKVVDVPSCPIATEALNQALPAERAKACAGGQPKGKLLLRDTVVDGVVTDPFRIVTERVPKFGAFHFRAGGFFQNNSSILPVFVEHVITAASAARVDGVSPRALVDIFCGVGLFALSAASRFQRVIGIEVDATAVRLARRNAAEHGCEAEFLAADAAEGLAQVAAAVAPEDAVAILDPPRQGLTAEAREALASWRPRRVVYVSCDCATQARDLKDLVDAGYTIQRLHLISFLKRATWRLSSRLSVMQRSERSNLARGQEGGWSAKKQFQSYFPLLLSVVRTSRMRGSRIAALAALALALWAGRAFIAPSKAPARTSKTQMGFFDQDKSMVKKTEEKKSLGGIWDAIQVVDDYTKEGSASIKGPFAGVPWLTIVYFVIFFWLINIFVTEGGKPDKPITP